MPIFTESIRCIFYFLDVENKLMKCKKKKYYYQVAIAVLTRVRHYQVEITIKIFL